VAPVDERYDTLAGGAQFLTEPSAAKVFGVGSVVVANKQGVPDGNCQEVCQARSGERTRSRGYTRSRRTGSRTGQKSRQTQSGGQGQASHQASASAPAQPQGGLALPDRQKTLNRVSLQRLKR